MRARRASFIIGLLAAMAGASNAWAQAPAAAASAPPPTTWKGTVSGGLALTSGNSDSSTINASYEIVRDARKRLIFKSSGLLIRGTNDEGLTADRRVADARLDYRISPRFFAFGQVSYQHDRFQQIEYLLAPTVGAGANLIDTAGTKLVVDSSVGLALENNSGPDADARAKPAAVFGERWSHQLTTTTRLTQSATALLHLGDLGDVLYTFGSGIAVSITARSELKAEVLDTFKNVPAADDLQRNDVAVLMSVVFRF